MVLIKHVKLGDFGGRSAATIASTQLWVAPPIGEAQPIIEWWKTNPTVISISSQRGQKNGGEFLITKIEKWKRERERKILIVLYFCFPDGNSDYANKDLGWKTCAQIKEENLGRDGVATFKFRGMIVNVRHEGVLW